MARGETRRFWTDEGEALLEPQEGRFEDMIGKRGNGEDRDEADREAHHRVVG